MGLLRRLQVRIQRRLGALTSACSITTTRQATVGGVTKPDTTELYIAGSWKWASLKYSHQRRRYLRHPNSRNSLVSRSAQPTYPINEAGRSIAHVGRQEYKGSNGGFNNGDSLNYTDWKVGVTWLVAGYNARRVLQRHQRQGLGYTIAGRKTSASPLEPYSFRRRF